jgi:TolB-like protein/cytochrome c-type biogenesis protein CcmH/NrfG
MSIIEELRRRNVFRVGIAYVVITWLLLQVADVVLNNIDAPDWVFRAILLVLVMGFPIALLFAWAFEMTPEGLKKEKDVDRSQSITQTTAHKLDVVVIGLMVVALVYFAWDSFYGGTVDRASTPPATPATVQLNDAASAEPAATPAKPKLTKAPDALSIAVLPFVDMSPEGDQQYLSDGIAEELLNLLVQIPDLKVAARTSSFSFKGENVKIDEVARELRVAHVLEGSVRKAGNRVRITAQLIKADDGYHLWSETFDRTLDDVFAIQDEISAAVVAALKVQLLGAAPKSVEVNPEAYALYLQGRYFFVRRTQQDWENAALAFEQALEIEPGYANAWAGLSLVLAAQAGQSYRELHAGYVLAREAANKALELNPDLAEAHAAMGQIQTSYDWDWAGAEASLTRALELAPGNSHILAEMAVLQRFIGNLDVAIELNRRAVELDPLDMRGYHQLGLALIWAEQLDEALAVYHQLLRLNPEYTSANLSLSRILLLQGNLEGAMAAAEREREPFWREFGILINLYAQGNTEEADVRLVDFIEQNQADSAYQIATIYGFRGDIDQVFEWLELAYVQRDGGLPEMLSDPFLNQFSGDPRWVEVLKKVGLYEAWLRAQA